MKKFVYWISILLVLVWGGFQYWPVTIHVRGSTPEEDFSLRMPLKDKKRLEFFFREVCFLNVWAYTLLGSKPMSVDQYTKPLDAIRNRLNLTDLSDIFRACFWPPSLRMMCYIFHPTQLKMKLGWEALVKYASYFPNSRFALYSGCREGSDTMCLSLVDKVKLVSTVKQHIEDFQTILHGQAIEPDDLIDNEKLDAFSKCLINDGLIGTVLGYGRENAWLYYKHHDFMTASEARDRGELDPVKGSMVSAWSEEEIVNLDQLNQRNADFQPWQLEDLFYPRFACDPQSEETKQLKQSYREERQKILKYYEGKDIVEATLSLFNQKIQTPNEQR